MRLSLSAGVYFMINSKMKNSDVFQKELRSHLFGFLTALDFQTSSSYEWLNQFIKKLHLLLQTAFIGVYKYDSGNEMYTLLSTVGHDIPEKVDVFIQGEIASNHAFEVRNIDRFMKQKETDSHLPHLDHLLLLKIGADEEHFYLSLGFSEENISNNEQYILQKEINHLTEIITHCQTYRENYKKSEQLLDFSKMLYASSSREDILKELMSTLENIYPHFSFRFLLSHDYDHEIDLPVQSFEYSDCAITEPSTKAFTTGEVQVDHPDAPQQLYAPLVGSQGVYGVIQVFTSHKECLTSLQVEFISRFAQMAGRAIENVTLYQDSVHLISDLKLINEINRKLHSNFKFSELIQIVRKEIQKSSQASQIGFVYYYDEIDEDYDLLEESTSFFHTEEGRAFTKHITERLKGVHEPLFSSHYTRYHQNFPYQSLIVIPMMESEEKHGYVILLHEQRSFFTFRSFKLLQSLINHSTLSLTNAVLREKLEKAVITDYLTKLYSRNYLDQTLKKHLETEENGTLVLLDIDDFKNINDTHGHYIGDEVIIQIADIICENISEEDVPTRWGGEEFAIYLPRKSIQESVRLVKSIQKQVAKETNPRVTFSCGISAWKMTEVDSVADIFIRADKALYEAKNKGKNCIVTADRMECYELN